MVAAKAAGRRRSERAGRGRRSSAIALRWTPREAQQFALMRETMTEIRQSGEQSLAKILDKGQIARLKQIELQLAGPGPVFRPDIIEKLNINEDQQASLQELRNERRQMQREIGKAQRDAMKTAFSQLTPLPGQWRKRRKRRQWRQPQSEEPAAPSILRRCES